jgi:spore germination protein YaaH
MQNSIGSSFLIVISLLCFGFFIPAHVHAATTSTTTLQKYTRLFYYQGGALARRSFVSHPNSIDIFAPQSYGLDDTGQLSGGVDATLLAFAKKHNIKVMPLVTNKGFSQGGYQTLLNDPTKQTAAINSLITEAQTNGFWGWQIDFEQMDASYKDKFSAFVQTAYAAMKQNGFTLSVAVVAKVSDNPTDYPNDLWQKLIGVYDYSAIASSTDFVSVMSYDDPNSTGPIVEYSWLQKVLAYSLTYIPKEKLSLGIPFYYWQWNDASGKRVGIGGNKGIQAVLKRHTVALHYSAAEQAPYLTYWSHAKSFTIWYENAKSIAQKVALIKQNGLYGFSGWALGLETASVYNAIQQ